MIQRIAEELIERDFAESLRLYSCRLDQKGSDFHIEIELDGLADPRGAVSLGECAAFSRAFCRHLDNLLESGGSESRLPPELTTENYSLGVSSAGATRKIRIPEDLERFKGLSLEIRFASENGKKKEICRFVELDSDKREYEFVTVPKQAKKKGKKKPPLPQSLRLAESELLEARLCLES